MRLSSCSLLSPGCAALDIAVGASEPPLLHLVEGEGSIGNKSTCRTAAKVKWLKSKNTFLAKFPEKAMAPHSSTLAWKIPWTEEPGRLQSMGSLRVGHD